MGSSIEINDTLKISKERGFPKDLILQNHIATPESSRRFLGEKFPFWNAEERLYNRPPTRVCLVEEIFEDGQTRGKYRITKIIFLNFKEELQLKNHQKGRVTLKKTLLTNILTA